MRTGSRTSSDSKDFRLARPQFVKEDDLDRPANQVVQGRRRKKEKPVRPFHDDGLWAEHKAVLDKAGFEIQDLTYRLLR